MNYWTDLTDLDFKVMEYIKFYNTGRKEFYVPSTSYVADKLQKSERTIVRAYASLRLLKLIP